MKLFLDAGFTCQDYKVHERQIENRRQEVTMHRRWVQAVFTLAPQQATAHRHLSNGPLQAPAELHSRPKPNQATGAGHTDSCRGDSYGCSRQFPHSQQASSQVDNDNDDDDDQSALPATMYAPPVSQQSNLQHRHSTGNGHAASSGQQQTQVSDSATLGLVHQQSALPDGLPVAAASQQAHGIAASQRLPDSNNRQHPDGPNGTATQHQRQNTGVDEPSAILPPPHQGETQHGAAAAQLPPDAVQRLEWEEGGITPEDGPLTGSLFAEDGLEEVLFYCCPLLLLLHTIGSSHHGGAECYLHVWLQGSLVFLINLLHETYLMGPC